MVTWPLLSPHKAGLVECVTPPRISPGLSYHLSDVGFLSVKFCPPNPVMPSSQMGPRAYPILMERLARHRSRVWIGSNTTCHEVITLSLKGRSDRVCNTTAYKHMTLPSFIRCEIFIHDILFQPIL